MYRILKKRKLAEKIWLMDIQADRIAGNVFRENFSSSGSISREKEFR